MGRSRSRSPYRSRSRSRGRDSRSSRREASNRVFVGNLALDTRKEDLEDEFSRYGRVVSVWVARSPPGFAFVEMEDDRDAEDAVRRLDGIDLRGSRIRVELARGRDRRGGGGGGDRGSSRSSDTKCFNCNGFGHWAKDCDKKTNRGECYLCGKMGHQQRDCTERGGRRGGSRSRSRSPHDSRRGRSRSRSRSRGRSDRRRSPSRSRSKSPRRDRSRSKSPVRSPRRSRSPVRSPARDRSRSKPRDDAPSVSDAAASD